MNEYLLVLFDGYTAINRKVVGSDLIYAIQNSGIQQSQIIKAKLIGTTSEPY